MFSINSEMRISKWGDGEISIRDDKYVEPKEGGFES